MADIENEAPAPAPLPTQLRYSDIATRAIASERVERNFTPSNGTDFNGSTNKIVRIPIALPHGYFLDCDNSFLRAKVTISRTNASGSDLSAVFLDGGLQALIRRLSIEGPDGSQIEVIDDYSLIAKIIDDYTIDPDNASSYGAIMTGQAPGAPNSSVNIEMPAYSASGNVTAVSKTISMKFKSGILGHKSKYLPLGYLQNHPLTLVLELHDDASALAIAPLHASTGTTGGVNRNKFLTTAASDTTSQAGLAYKVSEATMVCNTVQLNQETTSLFEQLIRSTGGVQMSTTMYQRVAIKSLAVSETGKQVVNLPIRSRSCRALLHAIRKQADTSDVKCFSNSARRHLQITDYRHLIGGVSIPVSEITTGATNQVQALSEVMRVFDSVNSNHAKGIVQADRLGQVDNESHLGSDDMRAYIPSANGQNQCAFVIGQSFEDFPNQSGLESGTDFSSQTQDVQLHMTCTTPAAVNLVTSFAVVDAIVTLTSDGMMFVSS